MKKFVIKFSNGYDRVILADHYNVYGGKAWFWDEYKRLISTYDGYDEIVEEGVNAEGDGEEA